jgi:predicted GIY-YIG superfamily endonuclease
MLFGAFQPPSPQGRPAHGLSAPIARERQLKGWRRAKKLNLIRTINPEFKDLAQTWG